MDANNETEKLTVWSKFKQSLSAVWSKMDVVLAILAIMLIALMLVSCSDTIAAKTKAREESEMARVSIKGRISRSGKITMPMLTFGLPKESHLTLPDRLIVAARHREDTSWLDTYVGEIPHMVYQIDDPEETHGARTATLANRGNEASAYLQFIVEHYDNLPAIIVFLHGHRSSWHMLDVVPVLQRLKWEAYSFASLRYTDGAGKILNYACGNKTDKKFGNHVMGCDWEGLHLHPVNPRNGADSTIQKDSQTLQQVWKDMFRGELGPLPAETQAPCCSTFLVKRERILARPKEFYINLRDWIFKTDVSSYLCGKMLEHTWHMIFGEQPIYKALPECELLHCYERASSVGRLQSADSKLQIQQ